MLSKRVCVVALSCLALGASFAGLAGAQAPAGATAAPPTPAAAAGLAPLAWMVGTWAGEEKGPNNTTLLVVINARWSETRHAIVFDVYFESGGTRTPQYDGMFLWHPANNKITLWQVNRQGQVAEGDMVTADAGKTFDSMVRVAHVGGGQHFLKTHYKLLDADAFHFKGYFRVKDGEAWKDAVEVTYRRRK